MCSPYLLPATTTKAPSMFLVTMDILAKHEVSIQKTGKHPFLGSVGACPNLWKTLEKWMCSPYLLPATTTKAPSMFLVTMDILAKHEVSIQKTGKHPFLGSVGACTNLWKTMETWLFSPYLQPLQSTEFPSKNLENIHFWDQWGHAQTYEKPWKNGCFPHICYHQPPSLFLVTMETFAKHGVSIQKPGKHPFLESVGACPNLWKTLEKWMFSPYLLPPRHHK